MFFFTGGTYIRIGGCKPSIGYIWLRVVNEAVAVRAMICTDGGMRLLISPTLRYVFQKELPLYKGKPSIIINTKLSQC